MSKTLIQAWLEPEKKKQAEKLKKFFGVSKDSELIRMLIHSAFNKHLKADHGSVKPN